MVATPHPGANKLASAAPLALALAQITQLACQDPSEPCGDGQTVDVHFAYATEDVIESRACALVYAGSTSTGAGLIVLDCPAGPGQADTWEVDLEGASLGFLEVLDTLDMMPDAPDLPDPQVSARTQVADPDSLACGERGWLAIDDADGRWRLAVAALPAADQVPHTTVALGELGSVSLREVERDGCPGLLLRTPIDGGEIWIPAAATTPIDLAGVPAIAELGPRRGSACASAGYNLLLRRA